MKNAESIVNRRLIQFGVTLVASLGLLAGAAAIIQSQGIRADETNTPSGGNLVSLTENPTKVKLDAYHSDPSGSKQYTTDKTKLELIVPNDYKAFVEWTLETGQPTTGSFRIESSNGSMDIIEPKGKNTGVLEVGVGSYWATDANGGSTISDHDVTIKRTEVDITLEAGKPSDGKVALTTTIIRGEPKKLALYEGDKTDGKAAITYLNESGFQAKEKLVNEYETNDSFTIAAYKNSSDTEPSDIETVKIKATSPSPSASSNTVSIDFSSDPTSVSKTGEAVTLYWAIPNADSKVTDLSIATTESEGDAEEVESTIHTEKELAKIQSGSVETKITQLPQKFTVTLKTTDGKTETKDLTIGQDEAATTDTPIIIQARVSSYGLLPAGDAGAEPENPKPFWHGINGVKVELKDSTGKVFCPGKDVTTHRHNRNNLTLANAKLLLSAIGVAFTPTSTESQKSLVEAYSLAQKEKSIDNLYGIAEFNSKLCGEKLKSDETYTASLIVPNEPILANYFLDPEYITAGSKQPRVLAGATINLGKVTPSTTNAFRIGFRPVVLGATPTKAEAVCATYSGQKPPQGKRCAFYTQITNSVFNAYPTANNLLTSNLKLDLQFETKNGASVGKVTSKLINSDTSTLLGTLPGTASATSSSAVKSSKSSSLTPNTDKKFSNANTTRIQRVKDAASHAGKTVWNKIKPKPKPTKPADSGSQSVAKPKPTRCQAIPREIKAAQDSIKSLQLEQKEQNYTSDTTSVPIRQYQAVIKDLQAEAKRLGC